MVANTIAPYMSSGIFINFFTNAATLSDLFDLTDKSDNDENKL
jgi:hypothetical protein